MQKYNETGPLRAGARWGRRLGRCRRLADETTAVADPYRDCGLGWGHWPEAGGRGRRSGRAGRAAADSVRPDVALDQRRAAFLERRIEALAEELERTKALLSEYPRDDAQDGE
jgi:hypothetical protein